MFITNKSVRIIKKMLKHDNMDTSVLNYCLNKEEPIVVIPYTIKQGSQIIRVRPNIKDKRFNNIKELTYPPADKCKLSRANLKDQPMFYAALPTDNLIPIVDILQETVENLFHPISGSEIYVTFSKWVLRHDIKVFAFPVSRKYKYFTKIFKNARLFWLFFKKNLSYDKVSFSKYIGDIMACNGSDNIYTITASAIQYILNHDKSLYKGVIYPSQKMKGLGNNIALTTKTVDNCCRLETAVTCVIVEHNGVPRVDDLEIASWDYNGNITWNQSNNIQGIVKK